MAKTKSPAILLAELEAASETFLLAPSPAALAAAQAAKRAYDADQNRAVARSGNTRRRKRRKG